MVLLRSQNKQHKLIAAKYMIAAGYIFSVNNKTKLELDIRNEKEEVGTNKSNNIGNIFELSDNEGAPTDEAKGANNAWELFDASNTGIEYINISDGYVKIYTKSKKTDSYVVVARFDTPQTANSLVMQDDGNLVIYDINGSALWSAKDPSSSKKRVLLFKTQ